MCSVFLTIACACPRSLIELNVSESVTPVQVLLARQFHFNYTTPDRSRQEMLRTMTPRPTEHWPFIGWVPKSFSIFFPFSFFLQDLFLLDLNMLILFHFCWCCLNSHCSKKDGKAVFIPSPHTPKAPRHGPRPPSRIKVAEMKQIAAVLFQDSAFPSRYMVPSALSKPLCKSLASNRVLFYEDELCQAVAQNKLRWFPSRHLFLFVYSLFPIALVSHSLEGKYAIL